MGNDPHCNHPATNRTCTYAGVIWDNARSTMIPGGKRAAADLLRHMIGIFGGDEEDLLSNYKRALGRPADDRRVHLPARIEIGCSVLPDIRPPTRREA
ncbi:hypothetical protein QCM77_09520 [Bradyrhizobium sp. SSUT18]|uniref:hypothetical protein n=1 Tax=Bradyrhizobium sp. SSUT18 TaxID=3040602 RepID=UPI00244B67D8|nr:hypothetical protein [Bradyrhizobium sp. SSUT18]MDH2400175.1 hypothetical protein [Bradyrhizobium sp. SSUT18]